ncbi:MAG TPA: zinc ribbon domain-containing protein [Candidatus Hydrothermia bacterium]|mgnify:CR=1 FL=1|nr:zinc ribbon domain-containing protein [Candidatus Hydrothermae bacterium]MDD3648801.1 zinc ribbon domain-containing protein [Candidatus Hydrothermia bacterium]MDD5572377.1 zinc ribbon domain-containing protein [Candidatus Hydrothermia bacterium]HOK23306.1 zinc ribbon domain-containing protein [Candidatus Hydrothermia bacterium]HOL24115.1 zinc ribbon domain-containing protein [Candidatus Hydrothermia bacterium]
MPIFEFKCTKCGRIFEELVLNGDEIPSVCSECGGELKKIFRGSIGLEFKGSGFYVNDYGKGCSSCDSGQDGESKVEGN